jgi:hypothetical protein
LIPPLCIEAGNNNQQLTNEKDEFYDRSKSQRRQEGKKETSNLRCDGAGLCEAGKSLFLFLAEARKWEMGYISSCVTIDLIDTGYCCPLFLLRLGLAFLFEFGFVSCIWLLAGLDRRCSRVDRLLKHVLETAKTHKLRSTKSRVRL